MKLQICCPETIKKHVSLVKRVYAERLEPGCVCWWGCSRDFFTLLSLLPLIAILILGTKEDYVEAYTKRPCPDSFALDLLKNFMTVF